MKNTLTIGEDNTDLSPEEVNAALEYVFKQVNENISAEEIKEEVADIYNSKEFSDEEKLRRILPKIDKAKKSGFWQGVGVALLGGLVIWKLFAGGKD